MTFISYAQNFEDVMLWRALGDVNNGFYIDIGANDPVIDSVSMAFYKKGWRGVHVEPLPEMAEKLRSARPDELVKQLAIGLVSGKVDFYQVDASGLSTANQCIAEQHAAKGFNVNKIQVDIIPLSELLETCKHKDIHWMKIDVEGHEKEVLESWGESEVRPWILVIESTIPLSKDESFAEWEVEVIKRGYSFCYFDGLNRFYLCSSKMAFMKHFAIPPNLFDNFKLSTLVAAENRAAYAESMMLSLRNDVDKNLKQLRDIYESRSWRVTRPLRWFGSRLRLLLGR